MNGQVDRLAVQLGAAPRYLGGEVGRVFGGGLDFGVLEPAACGLVPPLRFQSRTAALQLHRGECGRHAVEVEGEIDSGSSAGQASEPAPGEHGGIAGDE